jgi:hypothetical protein
VYELWLMLNVVWELALGLWPLLLGLAMAWLGFWLAAFARAGALQPWSRAWRVAAGAGAIAFVLVLAAVPALTGASMADLAYGADWLALVGIALGGALVAALFVLPIALLPPSSSPHLQGESS